MIISDPKHLNEYYNDLFRSGDLEGLVDLYEPDAVLSPVPNKPLRGHRQIREQIRSLLTLRGNLVATQLACVQQGDLALLVARWSFAGTDAAGNPVDIGGDSSKLARKGEDGTWRYVIDLPIAAARPDQLSSRRGAWSDVG